MLVESGEKKKEAYGQSVCRLERGPDKDSRFQPWLHIREGDAFFFYFNFYYFLSN